MTHIVHSDNNDKGSSHKRELTVGDGCKSHFCFACMAVMQGGKRKDEESHMRVELEGC